VLVALSSKYIILLTEALRVVVSVRRRYISSVNSEIRKLQLLAKV
jgi:hypothetical protein